MSAPVTWVASPGQTLPERLERAFFVLLGGLGIVEEAPVRGRANVRVISDDS